MNSQLLEGFVLWLLFNVGIALTPIISSYLMGRISGTGDALDRLVAKGELLILCAAINAGALGEVIGVSGFKLAKILAGGTCAMLIIISCIIYSQISSGTVQNINISFLRKNTLIIFISTMISSAVCIYVSKVVLK